MLLILNNLSKIFHGQRKSLWIILSITIFFALIELIPVFLITIGIALVVNPEKVLSSEIFQNYFHQFYFSIFQESILNLILFLILVLVIISTINIFLTAKLNVLTQNVGAKITTNLFSFFLNQDFESQSETNASEKTSRIWADGIGLMEMIGSFFTIVNKSTFIIILIASLIIFDPYITSIMLGLLGLSYLILNFITTSKFKTNSKILTNAYDNRFSIIKNSFNSIKELLISNKTSFYTELFNFYGLDVAKVKASSMTLINVPRIIIETIVFSSILFLCILIIQTQSSELETYGPYLSFYAVAGFKLLPAAQAIFFSVSSINVLSQHLVNLEKYLSLIKGMDNTNISSNKSETVFKIKERIEIKDLSFSHKKNESSDVLNDISINLELGQMIGIAGLSGMGKSTFIDILMGLYKKPQNSIFIDGIQLSSIPLDAWHKNISYIQQDSPIIDGSILDNLLLGDPSDENQSSNFEDALRISKLDDVISMLPNGIKSLVGDQGKSLSGGQRQRIALARGIMKEASIYIFDEATSALDAITEDQILKAIKKCFSKKLVIIISHRTQTLEICDRILLLDNGKFIADGSFNDLADSNKLFQRLLKSEL